METLKIIVDSLQVREKRADYSINGKVTIDYVETMKLDSKFPLHTKRN